MPNSPHKSHQDRQGRPKREPLLARGAAGEPAGDRTGPPDGANPDGAELQHGPAGSSTDSSFFVRALARGLAVITVFSSDNPALTLSEVAKLTGVTRASARRSLLTLEALGYVRMSRKRFSLTQKVLDLGYAYLSSLGIWEAAQGEMELLVEAVSESSSIATLDGTEIVYVARIPTERIMAVALGVGSRLPAHLTSMGRILLAYAEPEEVDTFFANLKLEKPTARSVTSEAELRKILATAKRQGWALVDQELEVGVRSVAAPIVDARGAPVAAINVSAHAGRVSLEHLRGEIRPRLLEAAQNISRLLVLKQYRAPTRRIIREE